MASKGYTGVNIQLVSFEGKVSALCQSGKEYYLQDVDFLARNIGELINNMEDTDSFIYWYNSYLIGRDQ